MFQMFSDPALHRWVPEAPPSLDGVSHVELDVETTGLDYKKDRIVGIAVRYGDRSQYLPIGHSGGNLDEATVMRWARRELRNKVVTNLHTKFDAHMMREWGVDLEEQGCRLRDVGHWATLLDEHRKSSSLESVSMDFLGRGKIGGLDKTRMAEYHAGEVESYACNDVDLVHDLVPVLEPMIQAEGLGAVRDLEDELIWAVVEMERNGAPIDVELLHKWREECEQEYLKCLWRVSKATGLNVNPKSAEDMARLWRHLGLEVEEYTESGAPSFTDATLRRHSNNPIVADVRMARALHGVETKYLTPYSQAVGSDGILRYHLHQLRVAVMQRAAEADGLEGGGTVSGRFSSSDQNIQQVYSVEKQIAKTGDRFIIRQLFRPASGMWLSADAKQIEYRIFANYANSPRINAAYERDPETDFHNIVMEMVRAIKPDINRKRTKDLNFAKIFGAGLKKVALMLEVSLDDARKFVQAYDRAFPEVPPLIHKCSKYAADRGWVKTVLGRRSRFPRKERLHKALNSVVQGSAADYNKLKLVELHRERKYTGLVMRFTVHDEVDGDVPDAESVRRVSEVLARQSVPQWKVPILWDVATGENWRQCA